MPVKNGITVEPRITLPEPVAAPLPLEPLRSPVDSTPLSRLLRMAENYRTFNALRQALEIYWEIVEQHPETPEAAQARERLLAIGAQYEREGKLRQARALYERLLG